MVERIFPTEQILKSIKLLNFASLATQKGHYIIKYKNYGSWHLVILKNDSYLNSNVYLRLKVASKKSRTNRL